jgi:hypothetical protein
MGMTAWVPNDMVVTRAIALPSRKDLTKEVSIQADISGGSVTFDQELVLLGLAPRLYGGRTSNSTNFLVYAGPWREEYDGWVKSSYLVNKRLGFASLTMLDVIHDHLHRITNRLGIQPPPHAYVSDPSATGYIRGLTEDDDLPAEAVQLDQQLYIRGLIGLSTGRGASDEAIDLIPMEEYLLGRAVKEVLSDCVSTNAFLDKSAVATATSTYQVIASTLENPERMRILDKDKLREGALELYEIPFDRIFSVIKKFAEPHKTKYAKARKKYEKDYHYHINAILETPLKTYLGKVRPTARAVAASLVWLSDTDLPDNYAEEVLEDISRGSKYVGEIPRELILSSRSKDRAILYLKERSKESLAEAIKSLGDTSRSDYYARAATLKDVLANLEHIGPAHRVILREKLEAIAEANISGEQNPLYVPNIGTLKKVTRLLLSESL